MDRIPGRRPRLRLRRAAPAPVKQPLWLAVRAGDAALPALLDGAWHEAVPLAEARRLARLRGTPAGVLIHFPAGPLPPLDDLLAWLRELPVATRAVAYAAPAP
ncbi:MAG TPA: hypothetical protein PKM88_12230, partial [bacterium]|nr:hypothetical protein [bacterium]